MVQQRASTVQAAGSVNEQKKSQSSLPKAGSKLRAMLNESATNPNLNKNLKFEVVNSMPSGQVVMTGEENKKNT